MRFMIYLFTLFIILLSCDTNTTIKFPRHDLKTDKSSYVVNSFHYDSLTIPRFFHKLASNHLEDFLYISGNEYENFCSSYRVNVLDSTNLNKYYTLKILHELFTSETASNCSTGEILNIPYQWHWVNPNPRHNIYFVDNNTLLNDNQPPEEFSKYNSYADIDRTPYLYLSDLVHPTPKYYSASCDTFSTFGWCSEREMAFVCLLEVIGYSGKVIATGNHSWSEFFVTLFSGSGSEINFIVTVDNTFNSISWKETGSTEINAWKNQVGKTNLEQWYNRKAHAQKEKDRIKAHLVPAEAMMRIESKVISYLEGKVSL